MKLVLKEEKTSVVGRICEKGRFQAGSERVRELQSGESTEEEAQCHA